MSLPYVAVFLPDVENGYQFLLKKETEAAGRTAGLETRFWFSENSVAHQARELYAVLHSDPKPIAVLVIPVQETSLVRLAGEAAADGIAWFWLNRAPSDHAATRARYPGAALSYITPDQLEAGRIQGRQCRLLLPRKSQIVYLQGRASNSSAIDRNTGFRETLAGLPIEVLVTLDGNWTDVDAERVLTNWLRIMLPTGLQLDMVVCQNDGMAAGVRRGLERLAGETQRPEVARVPLLGIDGLPDIGQKMVDEGALKATIVMPLTGAVAIEWVKHAQNGRLPPAVIALPPTSYPDEARLANRRTV
jgi:ABC-type sugar transport system substrate-binding protein